MELGNCPKCGAQNKMSKTGNPYCGALCWKGGDANAPAYGESAPAKPAPDWDAKERVSIAQTCINAASNVYSGTGKTDNIKTLAEHYYNWIMGKKNTVVPQPTPADRMQQGIEQAGMVNNVEDVDVSQIPFN